MYTAQFDLCITGLPATRPGRGGMHRRWHRGWRTLQPRDQKLTTRSHRCIMVTSFRQNSIEYTPSPTVVLLTAQVTLHNTCCVVQSLGVSTDYGVFAVLPSCDSVLIVSRCTGEGGSIPFMGMLGQKFPSAQFLIIGVLGPGMCRLICVSCTTPVSKLCGRLPSRASRAGACALHNDVL